MAMLVLAMIPIVVFYLFCQKYIIKGVVAGAVKGETAAAESSVPQWRLSRLSILKKLMRTA